MVRNMPTRATPPTKVATPPTMAALLLTKGTPPPIKVTLPRLWAATPPFSLDGRAPRFPSINNHHQTQVGQSSLTPHLTI